MSEEYSATGYAHTQSGPLNLTKVLSTECTWSNIAALSAHPDNELHSCVSGDISPIMVALGKGIGKNLLPPLSSKCFANLPDDTFMMVAC